MSEIHKNPRSEILHSRMEVAGKIPNTEEIQNDPLVKLGSGSVEFAFNEEGNMIAFKTYQRLNPDASEENKRSLANLFEPTCKVIYDDAQKRNHPIGIVFVQFLATRIPDYEAENIPIGGAMLPHTDEEVGPFYFGAIGATTKIWEHDFEVEKDAPKDARRKAYSEEIRTLELEPVSPQSGEMVYFDKSVVHQSPQADHNLAGQERITIQAQVHSPSDTDISEKEGWHLLQ